MKRRDTTACQVCKGRATLYLCNPHIDALQNMLDELPWLIHQLEITRTRQDRLSTGGTRRNAQTLSPINVGAMELARETKTILAWMLELLDATPTAARIARHKHARHMYAAVADLVGDPDHPDTKPGRLINAINRPNNMFAGLCPTITGRDHQGTPIECANPLYAAEHQQTVQCQKCCYEIDTIKNRTRCATNRDLMTETKLLELLDTLGEPLPRTLLYQWIKEGRITTHSYLHNGTPVPHKIRYHDPRLFSLSAIRALRQQTHPVPIRTATC